MDALEALLTRSSAQMLADPAPSADVLHQCLSAAVNAPDHGRLRPWRFIVIEGEARLQFGEILARSLQVQRPDASEEILQRERQKPLRAPMIIVVAATVRAHNVVPAVEQVLSAGAAAQNLLLALHALRFGAIWKTGASAYDESVKEAIGLQPEDQIVGFIYVGTAAGSRPNRRLPDPQQFTVVWGARGSAAARA